MAAAVVPEADSDRQQTSHEKSLLVHPSVFMASSYPHTTSESALTFTHSAPFVFVLYSSIYSYRQIPTVRGAVGERRLSFLRGTGAAGL